MPITELTLWAGWRLGGGDPRNNIIFGYNVNQTGEGCY